MDFEFKPELFEYRGQIMDVLAAADLWWLSSYRSVDIDHREVFLEIDGVPDEDRAWQIARTLDAKFPWGIRVYQRDWGDWDWVVVILIKGSGFVFGGGDDGRSSGLPGKQDADAEPQAEDVEGKPEGAPDAGQEQGAFGGEVDGDPEGQVEEPNPEERSPNAPDADRQQNPMAPLMGGLQMRMTPLPPEELMRRYATILQKVSRRTYTPDICLPAQVRVDGGVSDGEWDGMVGVDVRLQDIRVTIGQVRRILPLLRERIDLVDLLAQSILVACRDHLDAFLGGLPSDAAMRYESLAMIPGVFHQGLTILPPTAGESGRLAFLIHCSALSEVLDQELQRVAAEAE